MSKIPNNTDGGYWYGSSRSNPSHAYLWPVLRDVIEQTDFDNRRAIDVGCGNGVTANWLSEQHFDVVGIDPSRQGIDKARQAFAIPRFEFGDAYDDLASNYGQFPLTVCLEVVEHVYYPHKLARTLFDLTEKDGVCVISTPYHGYWKNLALAVTGQWDKHLNPLRDGGHIKFFSMPDFVRLLGDVGFSDIQIKRVGRIPPLAKSMVAIAKRRA